MFDLQKLLEIRVGCPPSACFLSLDGKRQILVCGQKVADKVYLFCRVQINFITPNCFKLKSENDVLQSN
jgi:hypothetical protein